MYLSRHVAYTLSGLYDKAGSIPNGLGDYDIYEDPATPLNDRAVDAAECFLQVGKEICFVLINLNCRAV
jgi:hypothetical protein